MKIVFFSRRFYPWIGGVEKHVYEVSKELVRRGHEVRVITENDGFGDEEIVDGIRVTRIGVGESSWFKKFRIWQELWKQKSYIQEADIVHCHDVFFWYLPFRLRYPRKKVYITFHGYEGKYPPDRKAVIIRKQSELLATGNICVGQFIEKWYGTRADYVTYGATNFVQSSKFHAKKNDKENSLNIVFVGRLEKDTGFEFYIKLVERLQKKMKVNFTILGDGSLGDLAKKMGAWKGMVENPTEYIQSADIIFASSYLSILEALAARKFVIAYYDNPLKKDYLQMTPFAEYVFIVHTIREAEKSANAIKAKVVYGNTKGYQWAKRQTWEKLADIYLHLWRD